jgi:hypothetical protein
MATPLVRTVQEQGGTMYTFASAARDLTRAQGDPDLKFEFSHYALLDLPEVNLSATSNSFKWDRLYEGAAPWTPSIDDNQNWATAFQNYALNLEEIIRNDDDFDPVIYQSDAERLFFKFLSTVDVLRTRTATSTEAVSSIGRYTELDNTAGTGADYEKVIKYVGTVDVINDKNYSANTYQEVFVNVPSSVGYTPTVLLKEDTYNTTSLTLTPGGTIEGRSTHPTGLSIASLHDIDGVNPVYDINTNTAPAVGIDFDEANYYAVNIDSSINTLHDLSQKGGNFKFNAVLVYYDLYSQSNPGNRATNLYGVLLLDNFTDGNIRELIKYKPNAITGLNGNAFSLKLNLKYNTSLDNVGVENTINDFTTFSMDLFFDTTTVLENATKLLLQANSRYDGIANRLDVMENMILSSEDAQEMSNTIADLETQIQNASLNYADEASLLDMITDINRRLNSIINGTIPTEVQYNTNVIFDGVGTKVDKSTPNKIKINNDVQGYRLLNMLEWNNVNLESGNKLVEYDASNASATGIYVRLKAFENMVRVPLSNGVSNNNINIYIDDSTTSWKDGQSLKLVFDNTLDMNDYNIVFYTNKNNGWEQIKQVANTELRGGKPYIELVCTNQVTLTFVADVLR